ncbi:MAG: hypothetical protein AAGA25_09930 [Planctomycetota bacterium]
MLFKATLIAVIVYLAACYAYGLFLLFKLYTNKKMQAEIKNPVNRAEAPAKQPAHSPAYEAPAKAA